ncbi:MAG: hypothetical protein JWN50_655 [Parcubacteria group bacterium]|nr:hypothetical protein [Parcubacteria group bacterium]
MRRPAQNIFRSKLGRISFQLNGDTPPVGLFISSDGIPLGAAEIETQCEANAIVDALTEREIVSDEVISMIRADIKVSGLPEKYEHLGEYQFATDTFVGEHKLAILVLKPSGDHRILGQSKIEARAALEAWIANGQLSEADRETLLPQIESADIPEENPDLTLEDLFSAFNATLEKDLARAQKPEKFERCLGCPVELTHGYLYNKNGVQVSDVIIDISQLKRVLAPDIEAGTVSTDEESLLVEQARASDLPETPPYLGPFTFAAKDGDGCLFGPDGKRVYRLGASKQKSIELLGVALKNGQVKEEEQDGLLESINGSNLPDIDPPEDDFGFDVFGSVLEGLFADRPELVQ